VKIYVQLGGCWCSDSKVWLVMSLMMMRRKLLRLKTLQWMNTSVMTVSCGSASFPCSQEPV